MCIVLAHVLFPAAIIFTVLYVLWPVLKGRLIFETTIGNSFIMSNSEESKREIRSFDENFSDENLDPQALNTETNSLGSDSVASTDCVQVYLRLRPLKPPSAAYVAHENVLEVKPSSESNSTSNKKNAIVKHFTFTGIFGPDIPQSSVYENCVQAQIEAEESFTMLTYGSSGSGKTFTLLGDNNQPGMIPRALEQIFTIYKSKIYPNPAIKLISGRIAMIEDSELSPELNLRNRLLNNCAQKTEMEQVRQRICQDHDFSMTEKNVSVFIWISFVEIYNDNVYDLLEPTRTTKPATTMAPPTRRILKIVGNDGQVFIKGLTSVYVKTSVEALQLLRYGLEHVCYASSSINANSSRSHCIFLIDVIKYFREGTFTEISYKFCDLAGLERLNKTGNVGSRLKESQRINSSLLVLRRCLDAAMNRKKNSDIIPFRESKLTMLLQAALRGKEKLTMIVNVMPTEKYREENIDVLNFASRAKNIVFKRQKQRDSDLLELSQSQSVNNSDVQILQPQDQLILLHTAIVHLAAKNEEIETRRAVELYAREEKVRREEREKFESTLYAREEKVRREEREKIKKFIENFESTLNKQESDIKNFRNKSK